MKAFFLWINLYQDFYICYLRFFFFFRRKYIKKISPKTAEEKAVNCQMLDNEYFTIRYWLIIDCEIKYLYCFPLRKQNLPYKHPFPHQTVNFFYLCRVLEMSLLIHFTLYVVTCTLNCENCCYFFCTKVLRVFSPSRPCGQHSDVGNLVHLCSTKDDLFHIFHGFFYLQPGFDSFLCASFMKTSIIFPSSNFWKIVRWKFLFSVSKKVFLKASKFNKCFPRADFGAFCFPVTVLKSGRKSLMFWLQIELTL